MYDLTAPPCACARCVAAGVSEMFLQRDPERGAMLHGWDLKRWYDARDKLFALRVTREEAPPIKRSLLSPEDEARFAPMVKVDEIRWSIRQTVTT